MTDCHSRRTITLSRDVTPALAIMASTNNPAMAAGEMSVAATGSFFDKIVGDGFAQVGEII